MIAAKVNFRRNADAATFPVCRNADATPADATTSRGGFFFANVSHSAAPPPPPPSALRGCCAASPSRRATSARTSPSPPLPAALLAEGRAPWLPDATRRRFISYRQPAAAQQIALPRDMRTSPTSLRNRATQIIPSRTLRSATEPPKKRGLDCS